MRKFLRQLFCFHRHVSYVRAIYGDEINLVGGKRSWWKCKWCGKEMVL